MNTPSAQVSVIVRDKIMEEVYFRTREVAGQGQTHRLMMAGVRDRVMLLGRISMGYGLLDNREDADEHAE